MEEGNLHEIAYLTGQWPLDPERSTLFFIHGAGGSSLFRKDTARCKPEITYSDFIACNLFDVTKHLASIEVPVLVVTAEDDKLTPPKFGEYLVANIKNAHQVHIVDAGHIAPIEKPEAVNHAIISFLDQNGL